MWKGSQPPPPTIHVEPGNDIFVVLLKNRHITASKGAVSAPGGAVSAPGEAESYMSRG